MTTSTAPTDHAEAVAMFRYTIIGALLHIDLAHGERSATLRDLSLRLYRPPGSHRTRRYALSTIERWYYAYLSDGIAGLYPGSRADKGRAEHCRRSFKSSCSTSVGSTRLPRRR